MGGRPRQGRSTHLRDGVGACAGGMSARSGPRPKWVEGHEVAFHTFAGRGGRLRGGNERALGAPPEMGGRPLAGPATHLRAGVGACAGRGGAEGVAGPQEGWSRRHQATRSLATAVVSRRRASCGRANPSVPHRLGVSRARNPSGPKLPRGPAHSQPTPSHGTERLASPQRPQHTPNTPPSPNRPPRRHPNHAHEERGFAPSRGANSRPATLGGTPSARSRKTTPELRVQVQPMTLTLGALICPPSGDDEAAKRAQARHSLFGGRSRAVQPRWPAAAGTTPIKRRAHLPPKW